MMMMMMMMMMIIIINIRVIYSRAQFMYHAMRVYEGSVMGSTRQAVYCTF